MTDAALTTIGFDADDTLWHNERHFRLAQAKFADLLEEFAGGVNLLERMNEYQRANLRLYGYGAKSFTLSLLETAIEVSDGAAPASVLREILETGREILAHPVELLPHAREVVQQLSEKYRVILITKGDLLHQERKIAASLLGDHFDAVEIVSDKTAETYTHIFAKHGDGAASALMVGNSIKSDVIPAIEAGSWGVYVPHDQTWTIETAEPPLASPRYREIAHLGELPGLLSQIC